MFDFRVEVYTAKLLISGSYELPRYQRLSDALNSIMQNYIVLKSAIISPISRPQQAERVTQLLINHNDMLLVATLKEPEPPPDYPKEEQKAPRDMHQMMFFTASFGLRANFYTRPNQTMLETMNTTPEPFIPLNSAYIYPIEGGKPIVRDFVCLNQAHIEAAYSMADHESI